MFLPTTGDELKKLKWDQPDVILVTGDAYIDSPFIGVSIIGRVLSRAGFRVGIIAQPDWHSGIDICRLGEPRLFWGITGGCMDSMVANYTALKKKRLSDDLTAGGKNTRRPDRAVVVYANLIRQFFKDTKPLILGGVEASMRRIAHYDYWSDSVRRSILFDARADYLIYGMAEKSTLEIAEKLRDGRDIKNIRGIGYISSAPLPDYTELPAYEDVIADKKRFVQMFKTFYQNNDPLTAHGLFQKHGNRYLIQNPPQSLLTTEELDEIYALNFSRNVHPFYARQGKVKAMETIKFSITSHRGCYGECNFCSIGLHEGRAITSRSENSIMKEAKIIAALPDFKGYLLDVGGASANMYGIDCSKKQTTGACQNKRCLYPRVCSNLNINHHRQINLLKNLRKMKGIKKVFVASGIRYDLLLGDQQHGRGYMRELVEHHISGQLKVAPEHVAPATLKHMGKPPTSLLRGFKKMFEKINESLRKNQFLTYYFIAAHPGCTEEDMRLLKSFAGKELQTNPRQTQIFTPLPSTFSTLMYFTEFNPFEKKKIFVEKNLKRKQKQKDILAGNTAIRK
ncbi:MAG: YgiQ family radical SAM protein [Smithella sp.]